MASRVFVPATCDAVVTLITYSWSVGYKVLEDEIPAVAFVIAKAYWIDLNMVKLNPPLESVVPAIAIEPFTISPAVVVLIPNAETSQLVSVLGNVDAT